MLDELFLHQKAASRKYWPPQKVVRPFLNSSNHMPIDFYRLRRLKHLRIVMNMYSIASFIFAIAFFVTGLRLATDNISIFLDFPSLFIVFGGTVAAAAISFDVKTLYKVLKIFVQKVLGGAQINIKATIEDMVKINEEYRNGQTLEALSKNCSDFFLREGLELGAEGILDVPTVLRIMEDRAESMNKLRIDDSLKVKTLGKFPPAFGMMGTTIGMIVLISSLEGGDGAIGKIAASMGICLITTLYGVAVANLFLIPIAENMVDSAKLTHLKNEIILSGLKHIFEKSNPVIMIEELNSYLLPSQRVDWKKMMKG